MAGSRSAGSTSSLLLPSGRLVLAGDIEEVRPCIRKSSHESTQATDGAAENWNTDSLKMTWHEMMMQRVAMSRQR
jgi:hypothetical protein